jgi:DNA-binding NarL/FixJ family response regulator
MRLGQPIRPAARPRRKTLAEVGANKEIAKRLCISEATVKGQVRNILSKLGTKDRTQAAMIGLKRGIIQL